MAILEKLREAKDSDIVAFQDFLLSYKPDQELLYCFYEGSQDKFYYSRIIKLIVDKQIKEFTCKNKDGVLRVHSLITKGGKYQNLQLSFFIDRDFDPLINNPDIYETPFYSIENFFVLHSVVEDVIENLFNISKGSNDMTIVLNSYKSLQRDYHVIVLPLNAYLNCHADQRNLGNCARLDIDKIIVFKEHIINEKLDTVIVSDQTYTYSNLEILFNQNGIVSEEEFLLKQNSLAGLTKEHIFRGKFELSFTTDFLTRLTSWVRTEGNLSKKYKCKHNFKRTVIMSQLSDYSHVPKSLRNYLLKFKN